MPSAARCPNPACGATLPEGNGQPVRCPHCGTPLLLPHEAATLPPEPASPSPEAVTLAPDAPAASASSAPAPAGYEVLGELGRGGMGVVYQARHIQLQRLVALKMVLAGAHASEADLDRFHAEAEAIARLQHANIVQVYEVGWWHDDRGRAALPFFSLEYCAGGSLEAKLRGAPQEPAAAARLAATLARAVAAAHRKGVIHRDLKPANVLLTEDGTPKITDFGLAKRLDSDAGRTRSGAILGTPSYMAPEQAGGKGKEVGPAADIYALGAILYEMLTGRPPFRATTPMDTLLQVLSEEPVPPSRLAPGLPRDLETVCLTCLHKEPHKRYATADALADDLEAYLDGRPIAARPVGRLGRAWRWCRRNRALAAALAAAVVALAAGSIAATAFGVRASVNAAQARHEAERAGQSAEEARLSQQAAEAARAEEARQRQQAQQLAESNRRQFLSALVANGNRLLTQDDPAAALPWFAEAARLDPDDPRQAGRLDGTLALLPRPVFLWRHAQAVTCLAVSPDGRRAVTGCEDGTARVWDLETGAAVGPPLHSDNAVRAVAFSPDGKRVATAGGVVALRGEVRVWDATSGAPLGKPVPLPGMALLVGFSADGKRLTTAEFTILGNVMRGQMEGARLTCRLLDAATGKELGRATTNPPQDPTSVSGGTEFYVHAGTGRVLLVEDRRARVVDLASGRTLGGPVVHERPVWFARLSADGGRVITIDYGGVAKVRDAAGGRVWDVDVGYSWQPLDAATNGRGELALAFEDGAVQRYRLTDGKPVPDSLRKVGAEGWLPRFDAGAALVTGLNKDGTARVWEVDSGQPVSPPLHHGGAITCRGAAAEGRLLLAGSDDGCVRVWDLAGGEKPDIFFTNNGFRHERVDFDAGGRCLVLGEGRLLRFDPLALRAGGSLSVAAGDPSVRTTALSPDGSRLALGTDRGEVRLLDAATLKDAVPPLKHARRLVLDVAFSADGRFLGTRAAENDNGPSRYLGEAAIWDATTGKAITAAPLRVGGLLPGGITCIAFSPNGRWFAAGSGRVTLAGVHGEVQRYEAATGKAVGKPFPVSAGKAPVRLAFGPDGRRLAVVSQAPSSASCELALWEVEAGKPVRPPAPLRGDPHDCAFDPAGGRLAVAAGEAVHVWDGATGKLLRVLPHPGEVTAVRYQQQGRVLLSISERATAHEVYLWDAATGEALRPPLRQPARLESAAVSPDGRVLVTAGDRIRDRTVRIWPLAPEPGRAKERQRLARLLSCQGVDGTTVVPVPAERLTADWEQLHRTKRGLLESAASLVNQWHDVQGSRLINAESWAAAARQYDLLATREPDNTWWRYVACSCYLAAGDRNGLRRHAEALLRISGGSANLYDIERAVKSCLLLPDTLPDPAPAIRLAKRLEKADPKDSQLPWFFLARGIALYRAGRPADAAAWLEKARAVVAWKPATCDTLAGLFLAMARAKQGRGDEARKLLADMSRATAKIDEKPGDYFWLDRVHCRAALAEAKKSVPAR